MNEKTTIFALSSGAGRAGIAVVRVSGPGVRLMLQTFCGGVPEARQAVLRVVRAPSNGDVIDKGLVLYFQGPRSVTGEDMAEFHVHGSSAVIERLLTELASFDQCVAAEPGQFTRRAFENDRLDLVEVEGLADLLAAGTEAQRRLAMRQFSGEASSVYTDWHRQLVSALAIVEAAIDFADEDGVAEQALALVRPRLATLSTELQSALVESEKATLVRRGLRVVIAGAPNVGKSSLMNALAGRRAAIVSEIAGTTRDVIEAGMVLNGIAVSVADTAGLRIGSVDPIEQEGMARTREEIDAADIMVWVSTAGTLETANPTRAPDLWVCNKVDLVDSGSIQVRNETEVLVSVKSGEGLELLRKKLGQLISERLDVGENGLMVRARHRKAIEESIRYLNDAQIKSNDALEVMAEDVRKAAAAMASITGRIGVEDFLGQIFQEFCIGK
jgi:tRNA modification GTPase